MRGPLEIDHPMNLRPHSEMVLSFLSNNEGFSSSPGDNHDICVTTFLDFLRRGDNLFH